MNEIFFFVWSAPVDKGKTCLKRNDCESGQSNENSNSNVHFNQVIKFKINHTCVKFC